MLYIVPTPIGNLKDITLRALEVLTKCDGVICEDTRRTGLLLNHFNLKKPMTVVNDFNEAKAFHKIIERLNLGENLALVSDAGTPLISDPGYKLVRESLKLGIPVDSLPGPVSPIVALTLSGLPPDRFTFLGYLPEKPFKRMSLLKALSKAVERVSSTFIAFVSPHKLVQTLHDFASVFPSINLTLAKELTKINQKVVTKPVSEWLQELDKKSPKGEYIMLFNLNDQHG